MIIPIFCIQIAQKTIGKWDAKFYTVKVVLENYQSNLLTAVFDCVLHKALTVYWKLKIQHAFEIKNDFSNKNCVACDAKNKMSSKKAMFVYEFY